MFIKTVAHTRFLGVGMIIRTTKKMDALGINVKGLEANGMKVPRFITNQNLKCIVIANNFLKDANNILKEGKMDESKMERVKSDEEKFAEALSKSVSLYDKFMILVKTKSRSTEDKFEISKALKDFEHACEDALQYCKTGSEKHMKIIDLLYNMEELKKNLSIS